MNLRGYMLINKTLLGPYLFSGMLTSPSGSAN